MSTSRSFVKHAALALVLGALGTVAADAATITYDFTITGTSGPQAGASLGSGSLSYDDTLVGATGLTTLSPGSGSGSLTLSFLSSIAGLVGSFTESADDFYGFGFPIVQFQDGVLKGLNFTANSSSQVQGFAFASAITGLGDGFVNSSFDAGTAFAYYTGATHGEGQLQFTLSTAVPEPSALLLFGAGLVVALRKARTRTALR